MRSSPNQIPLAPFILSHLVEVKDYTTSTTWKYDTHRSGVILERCRYLHRVDTHPPRPCFPPTQVPWTRRVSPASKFLVAPGSCLCCVGPSGSILRSKPRNPPAMVLWPNRPDLTTPSFEHVKPFTSSGQTVYSCRMDLPGPTTSVGTRTDYSVGPWDYPACATRHLKAWSRRTTQE
jgi:hypothetical protein